MNLRSKELAGQRNRNDLPVRQLRRDRDRRRAGGLDRRRRWSPRRATGCSSLERSTEPQFKIGESLMPATYWTLERLGMLEKLQASHFPQEVQRAVLQQDRPRLAALLLLRDRPARELADLAGAAQRVRPHAARQRRRARGRGAAGPGGDVGAVRRRPGAGGQGADRRRRGAASSSPASWSTPPARARSSPAASGCSDVDPELARTSPSSPHFEGAVRDPGIDEGATLVLHTQGAGVLVLVHPAARRPR